MLSYWCMRSFLTCSLVQWKAEILSLSCIVDKPWQKHWWLNTTFGSFKIKDFSPQTGFEFIPCKSCHTFRSRSWKRVFLYFEIRRITVQPIFSKEQHDQILLCPLWKTTDRRSKMTAHLTLYEMTLHPLMRIHFGVRIGLIWGRPFFY